MLNKKAMAAASGSAVMTDPDFEYVTMLLHGDGTNGAQNNTFIDGSANNFSVTRNGNTTQGSLNPFGDRWSNYFDGTGDYIATAANAAFNFGSGDFTVEFWFQPNVISRQHNLVDLRSSGTNGWIFYINASNQLQVYDGSSAPASTATITNGAWQHIAWARSGTTLKAFLNGAEVVSVTNSRNNATNVPAYIGAGFDGTSVALGYISNVRIVKGTAVYTAAFTPPTAPLTAITNTSLLTCQSNRFADSSSNNFTITRTGDVSVRPFSPFSPSAAYSPSTNGGSGYFDGTGDYLTVGANTAFEFGTGQYTVEFWVYFNSVQNYDDFVVASNDATSGRWCIYYNSGQWQVVRTGGGGGTAYTMTPTAGQWYHIAATRDGSSSQRLFVNGVLVATATSTNNYSQSGFRVGYNSYNSAAPPLNGYISNLRVVKGSALYTATFAPSTTPLTAISGTSLLLNFINGGIIDNAADNVLETVGNAQISTSVKKYGTGSLAFDGTGDWLLTPDSVDLRFGTGNFTIEFWLYLSATGAARGVVGKGASTTGWLVSVNSSNNVVFTYGTSTITSTSTLSGSTWYHIAVVRSGTGANLTKIYIDGTNDGTGTVSTNFTQTEAMYVGANRTGGDALNGYIDDLRITKGVARYTANFTPPTAAFPDT